MLTQLAGIEWNRMAAAMNQAELENYEVLDQKGESGITEAMKEFEATKPRPNSRSCNTTRWLKTENEKRVKPR